MVFKSWENILDPTSHVPCPTTKTGGLMVKVKPSVKPMCEKCKIIRRKGKVMIICENPKHKQSQG